MTDIIAVKRLSLEFMRAVNGAELECIGNRRRPDGKIANSFEVVGRHKDAIDKAQDAYLNLGAELGINTQAKLDEALRDNDRFRGAYLSMLDASLEQSLDLMTVQELREIMPKGLKDDPELPGFLRQHGAENFAQICEQTLA